MDRKERRRTGRRQSDLMGHYISTGKISCDYERRRKQRAILNEMNRAHNGKGVHTVGEHDLEV